MYQTLDISLTHSMFWIRPDFDIITFSYVKILMLIRKSIHANHCRYIPEVDLCYHDGHNFLSFLLDEVSKYLMKTQ